MDNFKELETEFHARGRKERYLAALLGLAITCLFLLILNYVFAQVIPLLKNLIIRRESGAQSLQVAEKSYKVPYPFLIKTGKIIKIVFVIENMQNQQGIAYKHISYKSKRTAVKRAKNCV